MWCSFHPISALGEPSQGTGLGGVLDEVALILNTEPTRFFCVPVVYLGGLLARSRHEGLETEQGRKESGFTRGKADDWFYV